MSALPNASKEVPKHLFGSPPPKGRGAQPVAKHDQARITMFFTRMPVPGTPPGMRQQQEDPPEAAELGTEVMRDAGSASAPAPEPAAECDKKAHIVLWVPNFSSQQKTTSQQVTKIMDA
eukprot:360194-Chlamydomonas_euryale.AAC.2